jgi:beta-glucosidase
MNRRHFMQSAFALGAGTLVADRKLRLVGRALAEEMPAAFPPGFLWGAATAAYQIEGAAREDGRGESIWDRFAHTPGKIHHGDSGDVACDSYHRYKDDVALLGQLNLKSYRFSIAWPRVQPDGKGPVNDKGLDYYKRLTDALLEANIRPLPTLYHWDLPQPLEDAGGWPSRDTADRFADYTAIVAAALSDRFTDICIFNEPKTFTSAGYWFGFHAPGRKEPKAFLRATHTVNLAQGKAFRVLKAANPAIQVSSAFDVSPMLPATHWGADIAAAETWHKFQNLWFVDPPLTGRYPEGVLPPEQQAELLGWKDGDERIMRAAFDYIGLNSYTRFVVHYLPFSIGVPGINLFPRWGTGPHDKTDLGWDVDPDGFYDIVMRMARHTGNLPIEITENGAAYNTPPDAAGVIRDDKRIAYLQRYLRALARAIRDGAPIRAYHHWSLLDNLEWAQGFEPRFGLVYVDFADGQRRTIKESGHWFAKVAADNQVI